MYLPRYLMFLTSLKSHMVHLIILMDRSSSSLCPAGPIPSLQAVPLAEGQSIPEQASRPSEIASHPSGYCPESPKEPCCPDILHEYAVDYDHHKTGSSPKRVGD